MKKAISLSLLIIFQFISIGSFAQQLTNEWRLTKKTWFHPGEGMMEWIYSYDATGKITNIKYYQGKKKLYSIQTEFIYNEQNLITSYKESISGRVDYQHVFKYDDQDRLISAEEIYITPTDQLSDEDRKMKKIQRTTTFTQTFSYKKNEIKENTKRPSFGGLLTAEITYSMDEKGNMVRKTSIQDSKKTAEAENIYIYGEYDNKPNPLIFTGAYFYTELSSKQNGKEGYYGNEKPPKTILTYSPSGLLQNASVTYMLDNRGYTHQYTYTYAKIKSAPKPVVK